MKTISDIDINNQRVLIRVDFNVPIEQGLVKNNFRIVQSIKTIEYCLEEGCSIVVDNDAPRIAPNVSVYVVFIA